ncbi:MAG TPA: hypothetical protein VFE98_06150 [Candidatus Bathyarchaeia archaeon]|nr:hypothetical protein [Candidatus Bathyarchaeia archaeon]
MTKPAKKASSDERKLAASLFNHVWDLIEKRSRTISENDEMIHAAHASRYHWGNVGKPVNLARGEWQVSRVYAIQGRSEPALYHARRSLQICKDNGIGDFDLAFAYEALARASAVAGNRTDRAKYHKKAVDAADGIMDKDDRALLSKDLKTI